MRLRTRSTESAGDIARRLATARRELAFAVHYDYVLCNDNLAATVRALEAVVDAWRCRLSSTRIIEAFCTSLSHL